MLGGLRHLKCTKGANKYLCIEILRTFEMSEKSWNAKKVWNVERLKRNFQGKNCIPKGLGDSKCIEFSNTQFLIRIFWNLKCWCSADIPFPYWKLLKFEILSKCWYVFSLIRSFWNLKCLEGPNMEKKLFYILEEMKI